MSACWRRSSSGLQALPQGVTVLIAHECVCCLLLACPLVAWLGPWLWRADVLAGDASRSTPGHAVTLGIAPFKRLQLPAITRISSESALESEKSNSLSHCPKESVNFRLSFGFSVVLNPISFFVVLPHTQAGSQGYTVVQYFV